MGDVLRSHTTAMLTTTPSTHRLLYRGALSLSDSHILLDGLSFTASLAAANKLHDVDSDLFNHSLALALESMRGRPSLHLVGAVEMSKLSVDETNAGVVQLDVHPLATLSRLYFENIFCLEPTTSYTGRSEYGVRISLTDSGDSSAEDILVYAQISPSTLPQDAGPFSTSTPTPLNPPSTSASPIAPRQIRLLVSRILPGPSLPTPAPARTRPRPDDPTPRVPVLSTPTNSKRKREFSPSAHESEKIRAGVERTGKDKETYNVEVLRKARETMMRLPKAPSALAVPKSANGKCKLGEFKIPQSPARLKMHTREASIELDASVSPVDAFGLAGGSGGESFAGKGTDEKEKANKTVVKQAAMRCLADYALTKAHPDFHDVFQYVYRGTCFALRAQIRSTPVDLWRVYKLVDAHAKMYMSGAGS